MKRVLLTTIISILVVLLLFSTFAAISQSKVGLILYFLIMGTGNIIIPTFIIVMFYQLLSRSLLPGTDWKAMAIRTFVLGIIMYFGLWMWSIIDVMIYYGSHKEITLERVTSDFNSEFKGWLIIAFGLMIAIPMVDRALTRRKERKAQVNAR